MISWFLWHFFSGVDSVFVVVFFNFSLRKYESHCTHEYILLYQIEMSPGVVYVRGSSHKQTFNQHKNFFSFISIKDLPGIVYRYVQLFKI